MNTPVCIQVVHYCCFSSLGQMECKTLNSCLISASNTSCASMKVPFSKPHIFKIFFYVHMYIHRDEILVHKHVFQKLLNHMHSSSAKRFRVVTFSTFSWTCIHLFNNNCSIKKPPILFTLKVGNWAVVSFYARIKFS